MKSSCCEKYKSGKKACKECPTLAALSKKERKKLRHQYRKKKKDKDPEE